MPRPLPLRRALASAACVALAACADRAAPLAPGSLPTPSKPIDVASVTCTASVAAAKVACGAPAGGGSRSLIVGNQGVYVQVTSSNVAYAAGTEDFSFDASVQNLIPQPMGTTDGSTPAATGVRIFVSTDPHATVGVVPPTDSIAVTGFDGIATYTAAGQRYYQYAGAQLGGDGILSQNETSGDRTWHIHVPPTVTSFAFQVYVVAEVPFPNGYVDVSGRDTVAADSARTLTATARTAVGNTIPGAPITWGTGNASIATVGPSGVVTGVAPGTVTVTATSGAISGSVTMAVCPNLAVGGVYSTAAALPPAFRVEARARSTPSSPATCLPLPRRASR
ncbi:MAG: Ig domain protein group 2 domain protein [Gemmatimonadetes bacterium]|nr:Ig domain protein group 2 domain protein [Gemmatimonadota bacterium]